jgi:hypothetical protein
VTSPLSLRKRVRVRVARSRNSGFLAAFTINTLTPDPSPRGRGEHFKTPLKGTVPFSGRKRQFQK